MTPYNYYSPRHINTPIPCKPFRDVERELKWHLDFDEKFFQKFFVYNHVNLIIKGSETSSFSGVLELFRCLKGLNEFNLLSRKDHHLYLFDIKLSLESLLKVHPRQWMCMLPYDSLSNTVLLTTVYFTDFIWGDHSFSHDSSYKHYYTTTMCIPLCVYLCVWVKVYHQKRCDLSPCVNLLLILTINSILSL